MSPDTSGLLVGEMRVDQDGYYHIELTGREGKPASGSPQYSIQVLEDMPPIVSFNKPGRDTRVSPIQEVFVEAKAEDDYGIAKLELIYSVNGGAEKTISLVDTDKPQRRRGRLHVLPRRTGPQARRPRVLLRTRVR